MKKFVFEVIVDEGNDKFWEELENSNKTGCDEITEVIKSSLENSGLMLTRVKLIEFSNRG